jgi:signal peptidase I
METETPQPKRRNPWLAGIGNILWFLPLGHVYAGRPGRGLLLCAGLVAVEALAYSVAARSTTITPVCLVLALSIASLLWRVADAAMVARWQGSASLRWYQRWYIYLGLMVVSSYSGAAITDALRQGIAETFYMPSGSMIPTIMIGDRIIVDKLTYRWKDPERGDVIVFRAPPEVSQEEKAFTKRVIGLPGDTVQIVPDTVLVDGKPAVQLINEDAHWGFEFLRAKQRGLWVTKDRDSQVQGRVLIVDGEPKVAASFSGTAVYRNGQLLVDGQRMTYIGSGGQLHSSNDLSPFGAAAGVQGTAYYAGPEAEQPQLIVLQGRQLTIRPGYVSVNGKPLKEPYGWQTPRYLMPPYRVPAGKYFLLGDNRNDSNDSHAWGPLSRGRITGVTHMVFYSLDSHGRLRLERIGRPLQ